MPASRLVHRHAALDAALKRLSGALPLLEAATERLERAEGERRDGDAVLAAMEEDRGRLAEELGAALEGKTVLAGAVEEVAERLRAAGGALRGLIEAQDAAIRDGAATIVGDGSAEDGSAGEGTRP